MTRRLPALLSAVALSLATLTACGGGDGSSFCDDFRENAESNEFDSLDPSDPANMDKIKAELEKFKDSAPDELQDDYDVLLSATDGDAGAIEKLDDATGNIQDYAIDNCDVEVEGT